MLKTLLGIAAFPFVAAVMFAGGLLGAVAHLLAFPFLYLWERCQERRLFAGHVQPSGQRIDHVAAAEPSRKGKSPSVP